MNQIAHFLAVLIILTAIFAGYSQPESATSSPTPAVTKSAAAPAKDQVAALAKAAKQEGSVIVYVSQIGDARDMSTKTFLDHYGVGIEWMVGRGAENVSKLAGQRKSGLFLVDAMLVGLTTYFGQIKPMNITVPIPPLIVMPEVKTATWRTGEPPYVGSPHIIAFANQRMPYTGINTDLVKEGEITSIEDLLAPKWKGKIVANDPTVAGAGNAWFNFVVSDAYGKEKGQEYMKKLAKQDLVITRDQRLQAEWVARGKYAVAVGVSPSVMKVLSKTGAPIKSIAMKEGAPLSSGSMNMIAIDKPPHPNAAKLFVNWVLSKEGGLVWNKYSNYVAERTDVSREGINPMIIPGPKDILPGEGAELEQAAQLKLAAEIFKDLLR